VLRPRDLERLTVGYGKKGAVITAVEVVQPTLREGGEGGEKRLSDDVD